MKKLMFLLTLVLIVGCGSQARAEVLQAFTNVTGTEVGATANFSLSRTRILGAHVVFGNASGAVDFYHSANNGATLVKFQTYSTPAQSGIYDIKSLAPVASHVQAVYRDKDTAGTKNPANLWINYERD